MNDADQKRLEELQWKQGNGQATAEEQREVAELSRKLQESRGEPVGGQSGTVQPKKEDQSQDKNAKGGKATSSSPSTRHVVGADRGRAAKGVTTTKSIG